MVYYHLFPTAHGIAGIAWEEGRVCGFGLPAAAPVETQRSLLRRYPGALEAAPPAMVAEIVRSAQRYFQGERVDFGAVPLGLGRQEPLAQRIYDAVRRIGWGETSTYGAVAKGLGEEPETARYVGQAMARNPVPLIIPCHRVVAAGGKIGGFSAPGGAGAKARMLALEGALLSPAGSAQASFGF